MAASRQGVLLSTGGAGRGGRRALPAARAAHADVEELCHGAALGDQVAVRGVGAFAVDLSLADDGKTMGFFPDFLRSKKMEKETKNMGTMGNS